MDADLDFKTLKQIDQPRKDSVFGFIRQSRSTLPLNNAYFDIPPLVSYLVLKYFCVKAQFKEIGKAMELNHIADTVELVHDAQSTAYLDAAINLSTTEQNKSIYECKLHIERLQRRPSPYAIGIGLDSSRRKYPDECYMDQETRDIAGFIYWNGGVVETRVPGSFAFCKGFKEDDDIKLRVDSQSETCWLYVNDVQTKDMGAELLWNLDYHVCVTLNSPKARVRIDDFCVYPHSNKTE